MNDDDPAEILAAMRAEHRRLDKEVARLEADGDADLLQLARLKKAKLKLKDDIAVLADESYPDIIA